MKMLLGAVSAIALTLSAGQALADIIDVSSRCEFYNRLSFKHFRT